jgi:hypothetical protein
MLGGEKCCRLLELIPEQRVPAATLARKINPANAPLPESLPKNPSVDALALATATRWNIRGQHLTVGFLDTNDASLKARILSHMNAWNSYCNFQFSESASPAEGQVRISVNAPGKGFSSQRGTNILTIASPQPTMFLEGFSMRTRDSEFFRVVRHETGHTMGFRHEHLREEIVHRIDPVKAYAYFGLEENGGWSKDMVDSNVLTPLDPAGITASRTDPTSIMCYQLPAEIMKDGVAVPGGFNIDATDQAFAAKCYPLPTWNLLDHRDALEITAAGGHLYQRLSNGSVYIIAGLNNWTKIDDDVEIAQIAAGGNNIYKRRMNGEVLRLFDGPTSSAFNARWVTLKADTNASNIVTNVDTVFQLTDTGAIYFHVGLSGEWELIVSERIMVEISVSGQMFYLRQSDGQLYRAIFPTGLDLVQPPLGTNPSPIQMVADADHLYLLYATGQIWELDASQPTLGPSSFKQVHSDNGNTASIAASGGHLYQLRKNGEIRVYTGHKGFPWYRLQGPNDIVQIVPDGDRLYQLRSDGSIYVLNGKPLEGWHPELPNTRG